MTERAGHHHPALFRSFANGYPTGVWGFCFPVHRMKLWLPLLFLATPAAALDLAWPVACDLGQSCYIQQYPDHDPGPAAQDFTCGPLSYDGHDGTDIALPNRAAMEAGVDVLAAAPGTVRGLRDGIADFAPVVEGRECGNGVLIDHGKGWVTQYCHLRQGSVRVQVGQQVAAGQPLGQVGQSGLAEFPHLHLSVRRGEAEVDPFAPDAMACGVPPADDLWVTTPRYRPGGLLAAGFSAAVPEFDVIRQGLPTTPLAGDASGLVLWVHLFGARSGDELIFTITGPDGPFLADTITLDRTQAQSFRALGKRRTTPAWPTGTYQGSVSLMRDGTRLDAIETSVTVLP